VDYDDRHLYSDLIMMARRSTCTA